MNIKKHFILIIILLTILVKFPFIKQSSLQSFDMFPKNKIYLPSGIKSSSGLSRDEFDDVINQFQNLYQKRMQQLGVDLEIIRNWDGPEARAFTSRDRRNFKTHKWPITLYGGIARIPIMSKDAFALILCHELGHQVGGIPKYNDGFGRNDWSSNEGQADYWAATTCFKDYAEYTYDSSLSFDAEVGKALSDKCEYYHGRYREKKICQRTIAAGIRLAKVFEMVSNNSLGSNIKNTDNSIAKITFDDHPQAQCRLDTYVRGALCPYKSPIKLDKNFSSTTKNLCNKRNGLVDVAPPKCWYFDDVD